MPKLVCKKKFHDMLCSDKCIPSFNRYTWIINEPVIGKGTWAGAFCILDGSGGLTIGENCNISSGVHIYTHDTVKRCVENKGKKPEFIERKPVKIGNNVFIGANSVILKGVVIKDKAVVGAGSVVLDDSIIGSKELWAGNPAKFIRSLEENTQFLEW